MPSGTLACPEDSQAKRLSAQVRELVAGAYRLRVSLAHPAHTWPHPYCLVLGADGRSIPAHHHLTRTLARWVIRTFPDTDWMTAHELDLTTGALTARCGKGC
ncbi:hypothetical protein [Streptomyces acidiscabies]|uniref:Transcriptional regulator n=2 Tax=Streptomyces acidiscabies TaxID=42234 RepID=A0AAP6BLV4_9ACTN|nr:hypothetical protein [Streptomyces acidiscabies]MBP5936740.1 transcriptional regulator [Streptomyces sp. LBUM 1476]MBZ3915254.1 transcriptional regulator [Streptomyces acidiscabies]MDX2967015.1 transcriptional regulator [Streptomyces acidiscabies]MDX3021316.1 transcriptional regulator [Streptomyces acidiscabies]MDX3793431.1 transcriptional regulator [Streptomyces acidiscabies]